MTRTRAGVVAGAAAVAALLLSSCVGDAGQPAGPAASTVATTAPVAPWVEQTVDVGGVPVHLACKGQGQPTVVLVSNLAEDGAATWGRSGVPDLLAGEHRVCTYDRPGLGASGPANAPRTVDAHVTELASVVSGAGLGPDVVVVGQGYGTFIARLFADQHPEQVAAMVLVDPPLWPYDYDVPGGLTPGEELEFVSTIDINMRLAEYGPASLPPPPRPTYVVGVDWGRPFLPDAAPEGAPRPPTTRQPGDSPDERRDSQQLLASKSPFGRFVPLEVGSYAQYWDPQAVADIIDRALVDAERTRR